jgi:hypothetical protein
MSNKVGLQEASFRDIRYRFDLPAQMACSVSRQVDITYKTLVYNVKTTVGSGTYQEAVQRPGPDAVAHRADAQLQLPA